MVTEAVDGAADEVVVWDPLVRIFHWSLALAFVIAYFTDDDVLALHVWSGYAVGGLLFFRVVWGFIGPKHARFTDFVFGPVTVLKYTHDAVMFRAKRYIGHNPAGGLMIMMLLAFLMATVWSGLELHAVENNAGPLASSSLSLAASALADDDDDDDRGRKEDSNSDFWEDVHEVLSNMTLALVLLHIAGVVFSSLAHRENLVRSMITGRKRPLEGAD